MLKIQFSPNAHFVARSTPKNTLCTIETATSKVATLVWEFDATNAISIIRFSPDSSSIAVGSTQGSVLVWDISSKTLIAQLDNGLYSSAISSLEFNTAGTTIIFNDGGLYANAVQAWEYEASGRSADAVRTLKMEGYTVCSCLLLLKRILKNHIHTEEKRPQASIASIAFVPNSTRILSVDSDGGVQFWDLSSGAALFYLQLTGCKFRCFEFKKSSSPAGYNI